MMIAFITFNSSLIPLFGGLWSWNPWEFEVSGFRRNRTDDLGIDSPLLWPTEPRLHVRYREVCMCEISTQQWPITRITLFERTWARDSTLRRHHLTEASEFLCIKTPPFLREFRNKKMCQNNPEMLSPARYQRHVFKISRLVPPKKKTALRAVFWTRASRSFNWSINSGPNILRSCLLHWWSHGTHDVKRSVRKVRRI